jgi:hypothetical protein
VIYYIEHTCAEYELELLKKQSATISAKTPAATRPVVAQ